MFLAGDADLFVRSADGAVIAVITGAGLRSGGKETFGDGGVDDFGGAGKEAKGAIGDGDFDFGVAAAFGAIVEPAGRDRQVEEALGGEGVEERLEGGTTAEIAGNALGLAAGFVVGDTEGAAIGVGFDEVDGAAQTDALGDLDFAGGAGGIVSGIGAVGETEGKFEMTGLPLGLEGGGTADPTAEIETQIFDFVFPNGGNGGSKVLFEAGRGFIENPVAEFEGSIETEWVDGDQALSGQGAEPGELDSVEEGTAGKRIHALDGDGFLARAELVNALEQEAIGAGGELFEGRRGVDALAKAVFGEGAKSFRGGIDEAIGGEPGRAPAAGAIAKAAGRVGIALEQVVGGAFGFGGWKAGGAIEDSEIELGVVDGVGGIARRGPAEASRSGLGGAGFEGFEFGELTFGGAEHFERVEGGDARPGLFAVHAGIGNDELVEGGGCGGVKEQTLFGDLAGAAEQVRGDLAARGIE